MSIEVGTILVTKPLCEIAEAGGDHTGMVEDTEYVVEKIEFDLITVCNGYLFTLTPDESGLSYATFFTVKEV